MIWWAKSAGAGLAPSPASPPLPQSWGRAATATLTAERLAVRNSDRAGAGSDVPTTALPQTWGRDAEGREGASPAPADFPNKITNSPAAPAIDQAGSVYHTPYELAMPMGSLRSVRLSRLTRWTSHLLVGRSTRSWASNKPELNNRYRGVPSFDPARPGLSSWRPACSPLAAGKRPARRRTAPPRARRRRRQAPRPRRSRRAPRRRPQPLPQRLPLPQRPPPALPPRPLRRQLRQPARSRRQLRPRQPPRPPRPPPSSTGNTTAR